MDKLQCVGVPLAFRLPFVSSVEFCKKENPYLFFFPVPLLQELSVKSVFLCPVLLFKANLHLPILKKMDFGLGRKLV